MTSPQVFVGIDVSKKQLDLAFRPEGRFAAPNDEAGFAQVIARLSTVSPALVVLEATGGIEIPLAGALAAAGVPVVVVNPRQVRDFAKAGRGAGSARSGAVAPRSGRRCTWPRWSPHASIP